MENRDSPWGWPCVCIQHNHTAGRNIFIVKDYCYSTSDVSLWGPQGPQGPYPDANLAIDIEFDSFEELVKWMRSRFGFPQDPIEVKLS